MMVVSWNTRVATALISAVALCAGLSTAARLNQGSGLWSKAAQDTQHIGADPTIRPSAGLSYTAEALADHVSELPGIGPVEGFSLFSGYVSVDAKADRQLFYAYAESSNALSDPVILWLNGGPGCSSIGGGFMSEMGPWFPQPNGKGLMVNPAAWNQFAHVIFLESLAGVGFSYSGDRDDLTVGDARAASDSRRFMVSFFKRFPHLIENEFYIAGESYSGHYVPQLAAEIHRFNGVSPVEQHINLAGFIVGNPWTATELDNIGAVDYWYGHALISAATASGLKDNCDWSRTDPETHHPDHRDPSTKQEWCDWYCNKVTEELGAIDLFDIYASTCTQRGDQAQLSVQAMANAMRGAPGGLSARVAMAGAAQRKVSRQRVGAAAAALVGDAQFIDPCVSDYVDVYLNSREVQAALHANQTSAARRAMPYTWVGCSGVVDYSQHDLMTSMMPIYQDLLATTDLRIMIYSGDVDGIVPVTGTRRWVAALNLPERRTWRPWVTCDDEQVGGYIVEYEGLTFATVRDAGHMVPYTQATRMIHLLKSYLKR